MIFDVSCLLHIEDLEPHMFSIIDCEPILVVDENIACIGIPSNFSYIILEATWKRCFDFEAQRHSLDVAEKASRYQGMVVSVTKKIFKRCWPLKSFLRGTHDWGV